MDHTKFEILGSRTYYENTLSVTGLTLITCLKATSQTVLKKMQVLASFC